MSVSRLLHPRSVARHAAPSRLAPALLAGGLTAAFLVAEGGFGAGAASAASSDDFRRLRACESGGNYQINTGNGFYGAYQFDRGTWNGLGYAGVASSASPATQDAAARRLQSQRGWSPWPACSRSLGLRSGGTSSPAPRVVHHARPVARPVTRHAVRPVARHTGARPAARATSVRWGGHVLTVADVRARRADATAWQRRMAARGWPIAVDGRFGPQSAGVATRFAREKSLVAKPGTVGKSVYLGAWTLRVT